MKGAPVEAQVAYNSLLERLNASERENRSLNRTIKLLERTKELYNINIEAQLTRSRSVVDKLTTAKAMAEASNHAKSEFLAKMSHEFRTPLHAIIGMTKIAIASDDDARKEECLVKVQEASHHLLSIINDILDISNMESDNIKFNDVEFDFRELVEKAFEELKAYIDEKQHSYTISIDKALPPVMIGDDVRFFQAISNILHNAIKFTWRGGHIRFNAKLGNAPNTMQIEIIDNGIGIPPDRFQSLFNAFEQIDGGQTTKEGGSGLGLTIANRIIDKMGGTISIESALGEWSTFTINMPLRYPGEKSDKPMYEDTGYILVVDDVEINREIVAVILEDSGIPLDFAENGQEAVDMFKAEPERYNMILMDLRMPVMDGYEATRTIRALEGGIGADIPIIAVTANVSREDIEMCIEAGMNRHIGKPVDFDLLLEVLSDYLNLSVKS